MSEQPGTGGDPAVARPSTAVVGLPVARRERRAAARAHRLVALLQRRPDLAGVHVPADFAADSVRWSA